MLGSAARSEAQDADPFEHGWILDAGASDLQFLSVKKSVIAETSSFATLSGLITDTGAAQIRVLMDSVDTKIDLRNVRMRFLFFETFLFPEATISAQLDAGQLRDLHTTRRKVIDLPFTLNLHGVTVERTAEVAVTLMSNDRVTVASTNPIVLALQEFNLEEGRAKLQEAANVDILPMGMVSFSFVFDRAQPGTPPDLQSVTAPVTPGSAALETQGDFDREACLGRFEILSRTGNIYFGPGSARLDDKSVPLLENLHDIVRRCPDLRIEISGHTDSIGSDASNQRLSERRAQSVRDWLAAKGIPADRLLAVGYGETRPAFSNDTEEDRRRNRRIEFAEIGG
ncbi:OmpA family protein [Defluviimonas sp. WL0024]|uniref:OmpA family protein n=2 Tax=Albidovulum salinarum TaxID=2984153 RepID=A0ABT2XDT3_9RHOB|nr:OmpA family protein [Defluviimonas sp. WL0024]